MYVGWIIGGVFGLVVLGAVIGSWFTVQTQTAAVIERFARFHRIAQPGLNWKMPYLERLAERVDLRLRGVDIKASTKTDDDVFVNLALTVQYRVMPEKVREAHYMLEDEKTQIVRFVLDSIRGKVPHLTLGALYKTQEEIASGVKTQLDEAMEKYGFKIEDVLLTTIAPDEKVQASLNEIQAATNLRTAAVQKAEAARITTVKQAEAEAEAKKLQGEGIAAQRAAIVNGLRETVQAFADATHINPEEVMNLVLLTQYFDTLAHIGTHGPTTILVPHSPGGLTDLKAQLREAMLPLEPVARPNGADHGA